MKYKANCNLIIVANRNRLIGASANDIHKRSILLIEHFDLPVELQMKDEKDYKNAYALFLLVESGRITHNLKLIPTCKALMRPNFIDVESKFFNIFNKTSKSLRVEFF